MRLVYREQALEVKTNLNANRHCPNMAFVFPRRKARHYVSQRLPRLDLLGSLSQRLSVSAALPANTGYLRAVVEATLFAGDLESDDKSTLCLELTRIVVFAPF